MNKEVINLIKKCILNLSWIFPFKTRMSESEARRILNEWSLCPSGYCKSINRVDINYDLQIIVPVYNVEKFIYECLKSICLENTKYKCLVTIVNDGSTDNSLSEIERFMFDFDNILADSNITLEIISQTNRGVSSARNRGLNTIYGRYVMFVDSDDVILNGAIDNMLDIAYENDADIVQGNWCDFINKSENIVEKHILAKSDFEKKTSGYPWGKIYKYTVLEKFKFPEGFWFEDTPISFILGAMPYNIVVVDSFVYGYRLNPEGISATSHKSKKSVDSYWITERSLEEFSEFGLEYDKVAYEYLIRQSITNWWRTKKQPIRIRKAIFVLTCGLLKKYFKPESVNDMFLEKINCSLEKRQFIRFELIALLYKI